MFALDLGSSFRPVGSERDNVADLDGASSLGYNTAAIVAIQDLHPVRILATV